ncbi:MAG TPA: GNAT family N-acetyltransferase [Chryseolinea sp.]|nr:GNAT family N-acetyltransferase [Chryseolinea sp.]
MKYILTTDRLKLRQFELSDAEFIVELVNTPGWLEFIGDRNIKSVESANEYLQNGPLKSYAENGFGLWLVELKSDRTSIGMCGILKRDSLENPDIGFAFLPDFVGKGYAFEMVTATLKYALYSIKLKTIFAITIPTNVRSRKLLEKLGFRYSDTIRLSPESETLFLYCN